MLVLDSHLLFLAPARLLEHSSVMLSWKKTKHYVQMYARNVCGEKAMYFCLLLIRDGFLICITPSKKRERGQPLKLSRLCPFWASTRFMQEFKQCKNRVLFGVCSHQLILQCMQIVGKISHFGGINAPSCRSAYENTHVRGSTSKVFSKHAIQQFPFFSCYPPIKYIHP